MYTSMFLVIGQYLWDTREPHEDNDCAVIQAKNEKWSTTKCDESNPVICSRIVTRKYKMMNGTNGLLHLSNDR